jgi:acyl-CoA synthetase (AMP-forming)/AMP-acid ligase II
MGVCVLMDDVKFTVRDMLERSCSLYGDRLAVIDDDEKLTYDHLLRDVDHLVDWVKAVGIKKGDRVLIHASNHACFVKLLLACATVGAIAVPVNKRAREADWLYILADATPSVVVTDDPVEADWGGVSSIQRRVTFDELNQWIESRSSLGGSSEREPAKGVVPADDGDGVDPEDPFLIIYTAAIDGLPRGAMLSHRNITTCNIQCMQLLEVKSDDVCAIFTPLYHVAGTFVLFMGLHAGLPNVLLGSFVPSEAVQKIRQYKVTVMCLFAPMGQRILDAAVNQGVTLNSLRCGFGLESDEVIRCLRETGVTWYGMYAQTEVTGLICAGRLSDGSNGLNGTDEANLIGSPGVFSRVQLQGETGEPVVRGQVGEICVRGETVFLGYWNRALETERVFRNGWLHTGDLAYLDDTGRLRFAGRKADKDLIKTGGENVYPAEVERVILGHPAVRRVCVIGVPDPEWREALKAVVQLETGAQVTARELQSFCSDYLPRYKVPKHFQFVAGFPDLQDSRLREEVKRLYAG